jgi:hypothetical protein
VAVVVDTTLPCASIVNGGNKMPNTSVFENRVVEQLVVLNKTLKAIEEQLKELTKTPYNAAPFNRVGR